MFSSKKPLAWVILIAGIAAHFWFNVLPFLERPGALHCNDFRHIWLGAVFLKNGADPYDAREFFLAADALYKTEDPRFRSVLPYVYLPFTGVVLAPLTWMRFATAAWVWFALNHVMVAAGAWIAARAMGLPRSVWTAALIAVFLGWNHPLYRTLSAGQLNCALLLGFAATLWLVVRGSWRGAGFVAAFSALFKIAPGILLLWFMAERRWRATAAMVVSLLVLTAATLPWAGVRTHLAFLPVLRDMGYGKSTWAEFGHQFYRDSFNQSLNSLFHHVLSANPKGGPARPWIEAGPAVANGATLLCTLALLAASGWLMDRAARRRETGRDAVAPQDLRGGLDESRREDPPPLPTVLSYGLMVCMALLTPSILWDHYLIMLIVPLAAGARWLSARWETMARWLAVALAAGLAGAWWLAGAALPLHNPDWSHGVGHFARSAKLWTVLVLWGVMAWGIVRETRQGENAPS